MKNFFGLFGTLVIDINLGYFIYIWLGKVTFVYDMYYMKKLVPRKFLDVCQCFCQCLPTFAEVD
jgi:hypothetical protein